MRDQWPFPRSHHPPEFPPEVMRWYYHIFGEHACVGDITRNQEAVHESHQGFGHVGSTSHLVEDEYFARNLHHMEGDFQDLPITRSNRTGIRDFDVNDNSGGDFSGVGTQENIDPDRMSYEELQNLEESIGSVSKGLSEDLLSKLPSHKYKLGGSSKWWRKSTKNDHNECDICKLKYQVDDIVTTLPCAHKYHQHCIYTWLKDNKDCCICKAEVVIPR